MRRAFRGRKRRHDAPHAAAQRLGASRDAPDAEGDALALSGLAKASPWRAGALAEADGALSGRGAAGALGSKGARRVFSEAVFGARLARALDALLAMQRTNAAQIARGQRGPMAAIFTTPTGLSLFETDSLTLHFLFGGVSLAALVAHHRGALPHVAAAVDGLEIADVRLRARDCAAEVELGVVARGERRLLVAVHAGRTYVGIAPDATPSLEDEASAQATGAEIAPDVPGLALVDALLFLVDGQGLRPHAAWVTGVAAVAAEGGKELRLRVVLRNPFPAMAALCTPAAASCRR